MKLKIIQNLKSLLATGVLLLSLQQIPVDAQPWMPVDGDVVNSGVHGFTVWNDKLVLGGSFAQPCGRVAEWDSVSYSCLGSGVGIVARTAIEYNEELVVAGDFWNVGQPCTNCNGIARWDGTQWLPMGTGFNNDVLALTIWNGNLIAGGGFKTADGNTSYSIALWNGTSWSAIGGLNTAFNGQVRALVVYNNELWAGGDFISVSGCNNCSRIAKWNGTTWVNVNIPNGLPDTVRALYVDLAQNKLYMGGRFKEVAGDTNVKGIAVFDGSTWSALGTGVSGKGEYVRAITKYNGNIIIGGYFSHVNGNIKGKRIAQWNPNTLTWSPIGYGLKKGYVRVLKEYKGELYAGGSFNISGTDTVNFIAKWNETLVIGAVPIASEQLSVAIYPNPATTEITIDLKSQSTDINNIDIYSVLGQKLITFKMEKKITSIDISRLTDGIYFIIITNGHERRWTEKIIKNAP